MPLSEQSYFVPPKLEKCPGPKIENGYIILFKDTASEEERRSTFLSSNFHFFTLCESDHHSGESFAACGLIPPDDLNRILTLDHIEMVCEDGLVYAHNNDQLNAPWGISRLSIAPNPTKTNALRNNFRFQHCMTEPTVNQKVDVYVVGIDVNHSEFGERVTTLYRYYGDTYTLIKEDVSTSSDPHGHGTHIAATIGGKRYGIAKNCNFIAVQVFNSQGNVATSHLMALQQLNKYIHRENQLSNFNVVNMSFGGRKSICLDRVVASLVASGTHVVVAAGNHNLDADEFSPARVKTAITVGASTFGDSRAWFSNYGTLVDVYAPGVFICSGTSWEGQPADSQSNTTGLYTVFIIQEVAYNSGTSMSCAHISGLVAYLLSTEGPRTPEEMLQRVVELSSIDILKEIPDGSPNRLAQLPPLQGVSL